MATPLAREGAYEGLGQRLLDKIVRRELVQRIGGQAVPCAFEATVRVGSQLRHADRRVGDLIEKFTGSVRKAVVHHFAFGGDSQSSLGCEENNGERLESNSSPSPSSGPVIDNK